MHAYALAEAIEYLRAMLVACGHACELTRNHLVVGGPNIVAGAHLLAEAQLAQLPPDTILFNSEQLADRTLAHPAYLRALERCHVWDHAVRNLARLGHERAAVIPFLFCPALVRPVPRLAGDALLFYGALTPHRRAILDELQAAGIPVEILFGVYGAERDARMMRARAVLNLHKTGDAGVFEPIRCFYPLINGVPVISEATDEPAADAFRDAMAFVEPAERVAAIRRSWAAPAELAVRAARFRATNALADIARAVDAYLASPSG